MKKIILLFTVLFSFSVNAQTVMWAVDLNDGAEDDYLKLEQFYSEIHKEALKQGLRSGWSVWKRTPQEGDEANAAEYIIFDNFSSKEQMEGNGADNAELAQIAYKGKMSKRAITKMLEKTGSYSKEKIKEPIAPEIVFFGLIFVNFFHLKSFPKTYPPTSEQIVKIIIQINSIYDDTVSFLKNRIESKANTRITAKNIIVNFLLKAENSS